MNKLSKDQIQKIALSSLMMIGLIYCYFTFLITPLGKGEVKAAQRMDKLNADIAKARSSITRSRNVADQALTAEETVAQANDMIPEGAPIAWFPPRMNAFFARHNLKNVAVRSGGIATAGDPGLQNFRNGDWTIELPQASVAQLGSALAALENEEKLLEITRLQVSTQTDAPEKQHISMNATTLLK